MLTKELFKKSMNYHYYLSESILFIVITFVFSLFTIPLFILNKKIGEDIIILYIIIIFMLLAIYLGFAIYYIFKIVNCFKNLSKFELYDVVLTKPERGFARECYYFEIEVNSEKGVIYGNTPLMWTSSYINMSRYNLTDFINKNVTIAYNKENNYIIVFDSIIEK